MNRRNLLRFAGLASLAGLGGGKLLLSPDALVTPTVGDLGRYGDFLASLGVSSAAAQTAPQSLAVTPQEIEGPFFRAGAPTRHLITQPFEPGNVIVIRGRVWGFDTKRPIPNAEMHVWHADMQGHYDNDGSTPAPGPTVFINRAVLFTDATGAYEYQTIHPGAYLNGPQYRPAHIHLHVIKPGYRQLTTQMYFKGDPHIARDPWARRTPTLIVDMKDEQRFGNKYKSGVFDIVLAP